jgi:hypothetical protein
MRLANRVRGCPLVQDLWRKIRTVRPGDRPDLRVDPHLRENFGVVQRREHACPVPHMGQVHVARQAARERQPEPVVAQHLDVSHVVEGRNHRSILRQRGNRPRRLMCLNKRPVIQQFSLVSLSPLEHLAHYRAGSAPARRVSGSIPIAASCPL